MGMHPRWLKANTAYAQTQRTVDRQFLFKPDPVIRNIIGASAARAQRTHPIKIYWLDYNITHEQAGIAALSDSPEHTTNLIMWKQTFHRILAGEMNEYLGREGAVFSTPYIFEAGYMTLNFPQKLLAAFTSGVLSFLLLLLVKRYLWRTRCGKTALLQKRYSMDSKQTHQI